MSAFTDRIAVILRDHHWTQAWHGCRCNGKSITISDHVAHQTELIEEILTERRENFGTANGGIQRCWVSEWEPV